MVAVREKKDFMIRTDEDTLAKLRKLSDGVPVSKYLRDLAAGTVTTPESRLERLEQKVDKLQSSLFLLMSIFAGSLPAERQDKAILLALRGMSGIQGRSIEDILAETIPDANVREAVVNIIGNAGRESTEQ